jgi:hypothetical protein
MERKKRESSLPQKDSKVVKKNQKLTLFFQKKGPEVKDMTKPLLPEK